MSQRNAEEAATQTAVEPRTKCPQCDGRATWFYIYEDVRMLTDPPRQIEPWVRLWRYQCLERMDHTGERSEPASERI